MLQLSIDELTGESARIAPTRTDGVEKLVDAVRTVARGGSHEQRRRLDLSVDVVTELHLFVARRVDNLADAADIAQQALLLACVEADTCRSESPSPWLAAIARHLIVDYYRARGRFRSVPITEGLAETEPALRTAPDAALAIEECRERLRAVLDCIARSIRLEQQVAVLLADLYGQPDKDSASVLHMTLPCFKLLLHEARARLRERGAAACMLKRKASTERGAGAVCALRPAYRIGVTCRLETSELFDLRGKLLEGLQF